MSDLLTQTFFNSPSEKLNPGGDTSTGFYHFNIRESWKHTTKAPADTATEKYQIRWQIDSTERTDVAPKNDTSEFEVKSVLAIDPTATDNSDFQRIFIQGTRGFNINGKNLIKHKYIIQVNFSAIIYKWDLTLPKEDRSWVEYENPAESDYSMGGPLGAVNKWTDYIYIDHGANIVPRRKHLRIKEVSNTSPFDFVEGGEEGVVSDELDLYYVGDYLKTLDSLATTVDEIKYYKITVVGHLKNESTWAADVSLKYQPWDPSDTDVTVATGSETEVPATVAETLSEEDAGSLDEGEVTLLEDVPELTPWKDEDPDTPRESGLTEGTMIVTNGKVRKKKFLLRAPTSFERVYTDAKNARPQMIASIDSKTGRVTPSKGHTLDTTLAPMTIETISKKKLNWENSSLLGYSDPAPGVVKFWIGFETEEEDPAQVLRLRSAELGNYGRKGNGQTIQNLSNLSEEMAQYYNVNNFNGEQSLEGATTKRNLLSVNPDLGDQKKPAEFLIRMQEQNDSLQLNNDLAHIEKAGILAFQNPYIADRHPGDAYTEFLKKNGTWAQKFDDWMWQAGRHLIDFGMEKMIKANLSAAVKAKYSLMREQIGASATKNFTTEDLNKYIPSTSGSRKKYYDANTEEYYTVFNATIEPIPLSAAVAVKEVKWMGSGSQVEEAIKAYGNTGAKVTPWLKWIGTNFYLSRTEWIIYELGTGEVYGKLRDDQWLFHKDAADVIPKSDHYDPDQSVKMKYFNKVAKHDLGDETTWGFNVAGFTFSQPNFQWGKDKGNYFVLDTIAPMFYEDGKLASARVGWKIGSGENPGRLGNPYLKTEHFGIGKDYAHQLGFDFEFLFGKENTSLREMHGLVEYTITGIPGNSRKVIPNIQVTTSLQYDRMHYDPFSDDYVDQWGFGVTVETPLLYCRAAYIKDSEKSDLIAAGIVARAKWGQLFFGWAQHRSRGGDKSTFNTFSEQNWSIAQPSLSSLLSDKHDRHIGPNDVQYDRAMKLTFGIEVKDGFTAEDKEALETWIRATWDH